MTETYRLVFRGEVLEGQHKAVVKQRLGELLKLDGPRLDALFTGKAVTVRKAADTETAARFQVAFKRAGARLRVVPVETEPAPEPAVPAATAPVTQAAATPAAVITAPGYQLAPVGASLQDAGKAATPVAVDTSHLSIAAAGTPLSNPSSAAPSTPPDVSYLSVAELGVDLQIDLPELDVVPVAVPAWDIAKVGADLAPPKAPLEPLLDIDEIDFDVAPPGTRLAPQDDEPPPAPPDTSHIRLS